MPPIKYHKPKVNCFLYSVNSYLAHYINEKYYNGIHYIWCANNFSENNNPPSSNPADIYRRLRNDVKLLDKHSDKIRQNKLGLLRGVEIMLEKGKITEEQRTEILYLIDEAEIEYFVPLLYVVEKNKVQEKIKDVPLKMRAAPHSDELLIPELYTDEFDVVAFGIE